MKANKKYQITKNDYLKANRKGSRDAELENSTGWRSTHKVHKSENIYSRKQKHRNAIRNDSISFYIELSFLNI